MLATAYTRRLEGDWRLEVKHDGWRALVRVEDGIEVRTRRGRDVTRVLPELLGLADALDGRSAVLDGELVVGAGTAADFYRLVPRLAISPRRAASGCRVTFVAFDVLHLDGTNLHQRAYQSASPPCSPNPDGTAAVHRALERRGALKPSDLYELLPEDVRPGGPNALGRRLRQMPGVREAWDGSTRKWEYVPEPRRLPVLLPAEEQPVPQEVALAASGDLRWMPQETAPGGVRSPATGGLRVLPAVPQVLP